MVCIFQELFGRSYSRLAQYIGSKTSSQVKSYVKTMGLFGWSGKSSMSTSSFGIDGVDLNFTELIDDMEIPASMEEVNWITKYWLVYNRLI